MGYGNSKGGGKGGNWTGHEDMRPNAQSGKATGPSHSSEGTAPRGGASWTGGKDNRPNSGSGKS